tara:strand:- start:2482 stop:3039 length:558 start_codon:yes stop_codon:yes gene_type:complete
MTIKKIFGDVVRINSSILHDNRGTFFELYNKDFFSDMGINNKFIQDNISFSKFKNTIRGMHAQKEPFQQAKFLFLLSGSIMDFFIDIRPESKNFGKYGCYTLKKLGDNIFIPKGYLHGFCTLENNTMIGYKVDESYNKESEIGIKWDDSDMNITWPFDLDKPIISQKDKNLSTWKELNKSYLDNL